MGFCDRAGLARILLLEPDERLEEKIMKALRRWTAGFVSRFDSMVSQIENHDALVTAAIRDAQEARARAQVQLGRVRQDGQKMQQRLAQLGESAALWKERALRLAESDETRALECLRRRRRAEREHAELEVQLRDHAGIEGQLRSDLARVDERIETLRQQRNLLRTRQSRAEALAASRSDDGRLLSEIGEIFDRWEVKVAQAESQGDCALGAGDELEVGLVAEEEEKALREELAELVRAGGETS